MGIIGFDKENAVMWTYSAVPYEGFLREVQKEFSNDKRMRDRLEVAIAMDVLALETEPEDVVRKLVPAMRRVATDFVEGRRISYIDGKPEGERGQAFDRKIMREMLGLLNRYYPTL